MREDDEETLGTPSRGAIEFKRQDFSGERFCFFAFIKNDFSWHLNSPCRINDHNEIGQTATPSADFFTCARWRCRISLCQDISYIQ